MKFWKSLNNLIEETLPDWRDKFLSYKDLKKQLKLIYPKQQQPQSHEATSAEEAGDRPNKRLRLSSEDDNCTVSIDRENEVGSGDDDVVVTKEVIDFVKLLEQEIDKFNTFFLDQVEEYIIRLKVLRERIAEAKDSNEELIRVGREIVDFHGEMVLLENYSALNYTGLVKILKKYDKLSGALIRLPFIQKVFQEPFLRTDVLNKLVKECETLLDRIFSLNERPSQPYVATNKKDPEDLDNKEMLLKVPEDLAEIKNMESSYMKLTASALRVLKEIRSGSSTVSVFSLPPLSLQSNELEEVWKKSSVVEQEAK